MKIARFAIDFFACGLTAYFVAAAYGMATGILAVCLVIAYGTWCFYDGKVSK